MLENLYYAFGSIGNKTQELLSQGITKPSRQKDGRRKNRHDTCNLQPSWQLNSGSNDAFRLSKNLGHWAS